MLNELSKRIYQANKEKGFHDKLRNTGETLMLVVTEIAEALEAHRESKFANVARFKNRELLDRNDFKDNFKDCIKDTYEDEIADAVIRLLDMAGAENIDIQFHVEQKLKYNATRPRLHGKKY